MPSPGKRTQNSVLAKRNPKLLAHAAIMEYDVVLAEHAFHEMRLHAIAAGRSVSQATSHGPSRTVSHATSYSQRQERLLHERELTAHQKALEAIKHRHPQDALPPITGPTNAPHRHELAKGLDVDNQALGHRIETIRGAAAPSVEMCLAAERKREEIVNRLRTVKGLGVKQPPLAPEKAEDLERNWTVRATTASVPNQVVPLPPIVDAKGRVHETPRAPPHSARAAEDRRDETPPPAAVTARVRMPAKPPKLPVKPRGRPPKTSVPLSMALKFNPRNTGATVEELQSRARGNVEKDEEAERNTITHDEATAWSSAENDHQHGVADADRRRVRREELEKEHAAQIEDFEADEDAARQPVEEAEAREWTQIQSAAGKGASDADEAYRQRIERERLKIKRRFEALDAEENRGRESIQSDEGNGFAQVKKLWRKTQSDAEESAALQLRNAAIQQAIPSSSSALELVPSAPAETVSARSNWRNLPRVVRAADGSSQIRVAPTRTDAVAGSDHLALKVLQLGDGYVALALDVQSPSSSRMVVSAEAPNAAAVYATVTDEMLKDAGKAGHHVFELQVAENQTQGDICRFAIASKAKPGFVLKQKTSSLILAPYKASDESQLFAFLPTESAAADEEAYVQELRDAEVAAEAAQRKKLADSRRAAAESVVPNMKIDPSAVFELCLADDPQIRINRSAPEERAKLRAGERWGTTLDQFCLRLDDDGFVTFVAPDTPTWGITSGGRSQASVGLRFEALAGKEDLGAFEIEAVPALSDDDPDRRFFLRPKACLEMVVEAKMDSETHRLVLVPEADASNLGEFLLQPLDVARNQFQELESEKAAAEAKAIEDRLAVIEAVFGARPEASVPYEIAVADDPTVRVTRLGPKAVVGSRLNSIEDQLFVHVDDSGYVSFVSAMDDALPLSVTIGAKGKGTFGFHSNAAVNSTLFTIDAATLSDSQTGDQTRFCIRPKGASSLVEVDVERGILILVKEDDASNLGEFIALLHSVAQQEYEAAQADLRQQVSEEAMQARCDALEAIVGDPELMIVYDIVPVYDPNMRLAVIDEKSGTLAIEPVRDSESQQFVFADVGEGYVNIVPWSTPQAALTGSLTDGTCLVAEGSAAVEGQHYEIVLHGEDGQFSLVPRAAPMKHLAVDKATMQIRLIESDEKDPMSHFKLVQRETANADLMSDSGAPLSDHSGDFKRRSEALEMICGSIMENVDVIELYPADAPRLRLSIATQGDTAVEGDQVVLHARKGAAVEQFTLVDAGDGYVHLVPWSDPNLALWVNDDMTTVAFKPSEVGHKMCCFELAVADKSPRSPKKGGRLKFFIVPRVLPHSVLDITDDEAAPLALMPDSALSPMAEMCLIKKEDADAQAMERSMQRRQSKLDALAKARRDAAVSIFGSGYQTVQIAPVDDGDRRMAVKAPFDDPAAFVIAEPTVFAALPPEQVKVTVVPVAAGYIALSFEAEGRLYVVVTPSGNATGVSLQVVDRAAIDDPTLLPDASHFEVLILSDPGCFCLGPKVRPDHFIEAQLNDDGHFALVPEKEASSFAEMRLVKT